MRPDRPARATSTAHPPRDTAVAAAITALLDDRTPRSWRDVHPYAKWTGAFWRLQTLVDLGVDPATPALRDLLDRALDWLLDPDRARRRSEAVIDGRTRWCGSQEGMGVLVATYAGHADDPRTRRLVETLLSIQWPDGGWNCDVTPSASHSSLHETHGPLRGLAAYHHATADPEALAAARRAAELLLDHRLFRSRRTGEVIHPSFTQLHWPPYWHYDVLVGLRGLHALGLLTDPRAADALDLLEDARRRDGTWHPTGRRHWRPPGATRSGVETIDLSAVAPLVVTRHATAILEQAGRAPGRSTAAT